MAKPNLALIPATIGDKVYSILPSDGVGDFDFDRADGSSPTGVTRINAQGLIEEVASGENRLNYSLLDGEVVGCPHLLLENSATNLVQYSEDFSNAYWTKSGSSIVSNNVISPDGSLNASKLVEDNLSSTKLIFKSGITTLGTISVFAKKGDDNNRLFQIRRDGGSNSWSWFNLDDGIVLKEENGIASIENYGNGWYRCSFTPTNSNGTIVFGISNGILDRSVSYQGDGVSGVYIYGAMLEEGSYPTSYIKTTSAAVTRAAETCNNSGNAATFNDSEGVLMVEASSLSELDVTARYIQVSDGTSTPNGIQLRYYTTTNSLQALYYTNSAYQAVLGYTLPNSSENNKIAFKYKENDFALWVNGLEVGTDPNGLVGATLSQLKFDYNNFSDFYGKTKQLQYFDTTDIDLEQLTSWDSFRAMAEGQLYTIE